MTDVLLPSEPFVHFEIRAIERQFSWVLLNESGATLAESDRVFPSSAQASAAALAWSQLVMRAGKRISVGPAAPTLV